MIFSLMTRSVYILLHTSSFLVAASVRSVFSSPYTTLHRLLSYEINLPVYWNTYITYIIYEIASLPQYPSGNSKYACRNILKDVFLTLIAKITGLITTLHIVYTGPNSCASFTTFLQFRAVNITPMWDLTNSTYDTVFFLFSYVEILQTTATRTVLTLSAWTASWQQHRNIHSAIWKQKHPEV